MKKVYRLLSAILVVVQLFGMAAISAGAEYGQETDIRLGSVYLKDGIYYTVRDGFLQEADTEPDNFILYQQSSETIYLKNFEYTLAEESADNTYAALYIPKNITLDIQGTNKIVNNGFYSFGEDPEIHRCSNGINTEDHDMMITGSGLLTVEANTGDTC